jgi:hypothetical protein
MEGAVAAIGVNVRLKPGMPHGLFSETLRLHLSSSPGTLDIPVKGRIVSDIAIVGQKYRERRGMASMGIVNRSQGGRLNLLLLVKGPHRENVTFSVASTDPDEALQVQFAEPTTYETVVKQPIEIVVPQDTATVQRLASEDNPGRIVLHTTHPDIPEIEIFVSFAVVE